MKPSLMATVKLATCALLALAGPCASSWAGDSSMSLEEASYRAGKARIVARYREDLATCKGLGNPQARSACAAAAGVNRDAARRALKSDLGPTALSRSLAQMAAEPTRGAMRAAVPSVAPAAVRRVAVSPVASPIQRVATAPARVGTPVPAAQPPTAPQVAATEPAAPTGGSSLVTDYALAIKTHYGGN